MNSGELASLAGVTVRALRHYHHIGLLDEPPREANGYRRYDVHHLVRVLRIRRLAALGIALERMPGLLRDGGDAGAVLSELDDELAAEMDRIAGRRRMIAELRAEQAAPDLSPALARFIRASGTADRFPAIRRIEHEQSILLAHVIGEAGLAGVTRVYEESSTPELRRSVSSLTERFDRLLPDSGHEETDALAEEVVAAMTPLVRRLAATEPPLDLGTATFLFEDHWHDLLNEAQRRVLADVRDRFADPDAG
ncbi:MerR family transcriptional regulator [Nocardiopsis sp. NPDC058631]|uniref:MerR family transcriptional regulator n=1 Tax=Nocardiopsis sp. NPDC058631 TaxID=3346566 RepID=UPI003656F1F6